MPDPKAPSPNYNPYGKAKKGESKAAATARRKKYYTFQREHAEETGDQKTVDKIYGKLGKKSLVGARKGDKSLNVDSDSVNKKALAYGPALAAGGAVGLGRLGAGAAASAASKALTRGGGQKALSAGMKVAKPVAKAAPKALSGGVSRLASTGQKALPAGRAALPGARASQAVPKSPTQRALPAAAKRAPATSRTSRVVGGKYTRGAAPNKSASNARTGNAKSVKTKRTGTKAKGR